MTKLALAAIAAASLMLSGAAHAQQPAAAPPPVPITAPFFVLFIPCQVLQLLIKSTPAKAVATSTFIRFIIVSFI